MSIGAALGGDRYTMPTLSRCAWIRDFIYTTRDRNTGRAFPVYRADCTPKPAADVIKGLA